MPHFHKAAQLGCVRYKGPDEVSYEVRSASGKVEAHIVRITVMDASPADTKPAPDTDPDL